MNKLSEPDAIVALSYVMPDMPIRTVVESVIRLYENGYALVAPERSQWRATSDTTVLSNQEQAKAIAPLPFHTKQPTNVYGDINHTCTCTEYDGHESYPYRETIR